MVAAQPAAAYPTYGNAMPIEELPWYEGPDFTGQPQEVQERGAAR